MIGSRIGGVGGRVVHARHGALSGAHRVAGHGPDPRRHRTLGADFRAAGQYPRGAPSAPRAQPDVAPVRLGRCRAGPGGARLPGMQLDPTRTVSSTAGAAPAGRRRDVRVRVAGLAPDTGSPMLAVERRAALLPVYTAATIVVGLGRAAPRHAAGRAARRHRDPRGRRAVVAGRRGRAVDGVRPHGIVAPGPRLVRPRRRHLPPAVHRRGDDPRRADRRRLGGARRVLRPPRAPGGAVVRRALEPRDPRRRGGRGRPRGAGEHRPRRVARACPTGRRSRSSARSPARSCSRSSRWRPPPASSSCVTGSRSARRCSCSTGRSARRSSPRPSSAGCSRSCGSPSAGGRPP